MLPTEDLFVYVYVLIHDLMAAGHIKVPPRPGPAPACSDAEMLAIAEVRHLLGRRSEAGFLAEVARDWGHLFPHLPHQSEANRRTRWLWGAFEQLRVTLAARLPEDDCQQVDTSALPVRHPSRVRGPDGWTGPGNDLAARFGRDAAHAAIAARRGAPEPHRIPSEHDLLRRTSDPEPPVAGYCHPVLAQKVRHTSTCGWREAAHGMPGNAARDGQAMRACPGPGRLPAWCSHSRRPERPATADVYMCARPSPGARVIGEPP